MATYLSIAEVAEQLKVHPKTVRNWIEEGQLRAIRVGKLLRVPVDALDEFKGETPARVSSPTLTQIQEGRSLAYRMVAVMDSLADLLEEEGKAVAR